MYRISIENDSRKPVVDKLRAELIENAKRMAITVTEDAMNTREVYLLAGVNDRVIQSALVKESSLLTSEYEVLMNKKQKLMEEAFKQ